MYSQSDSTSSTPPDLGRKLKIAESFIEVLLCNMTALGFASAIEDWNIICQQDRVPPTFSASRPSLNGMLFDPFALPPHG